MPFWPRMHSSHLGIAFNLAARLLFEYATYLAGYFLRNFPANVFIALLLFLLNILQDLFLHFLQVSRSLSAAILCTEYLLRHLLVLHPLQIFLFSI